MVHNYHLITHTAIMLFPGCIAAICDSVLYIHGIKQLHL